MRERSDFQKKPMYYPFLPAEIPLSEKNRRCISNGSPNLEGDTPPLKKIPFRLFHSSSTWRRLSMCQEPQTAKREDTLHSNLQVTTKKLYRGAGAWPPAGLRVGLHLVNSLAMV